MGRKVQDLTGKKFNYLTVVRVVGKDKIGAIWECKCDCGNLTTSHKGELEKGFKQSCGCMKAKKDDIVGIKKGKLTAIEFSKIVKGITYWKFKCDCGNVFEGERSKFLNGNTKSCGCLKKERNEKFRKATLNQNQDGTNIVILQRGLTKSNKSGFKGVHKNKNGKWIANITFKNKKHYLGSFDKLEDAVKVREIAEEKLHKSFLREKGLIE